jgi:Rrf2 family protein
MLSTTAQYALRALVKLAEEPAKTVLGRTMAEQTDIPANYLSKILLTLGNAGIVEATRGSGGGYRLSRDPNTIRLIEVVERFDGARIKPTCLLGSPECSDENACSAHDSWKGIRNRFLNFLESTTLADISNTKVRSPLHISALPGTVSKDP